MPKTLQHVDVAEAYGAGAIHEARSQAGPAGSVISVDVIRSGWNRAGSRYYPVAVVERDVPKVYGAGTQMFIDHPSSDERETRPERSLRSLAAVFLEDPHPVQEADGRVVMRTTARVYTDWQPFLAERHDAIGVSINGGGEAEWGEAEGRHGLVLEALTAGQSVDFVTRPGAGGRIVALLESARDVATTEAGTVGAWLESRIHCEFTRMADDMYGDGGLTRDERIAASSAIGDALAAFVTGIESRAPQLYTRDRWTEPEPGPTPVATNESPAGGMPGGPTTAVEADTTAKEQAVMPEISTTEALELAQYRVADQARGLVDTALAASDLPQPAQARVRAQFPATALPLTESDRTLNTGAFSTTVEAAVTAERAYIAQILESAGVGKVTGAGPAAGAGTGMPAAFGVSTAVSTTEADTQTVEALVVAYRDRGMTEDAARKAAAGRGF